MQLSTPSVYTDVSQEQFDAFRYQARAKGLNITSNSETVEFDKVPVKVDYDPAKKTLTLAVNEPHWLTPGVTIGVLHGMVAAVVAAKELPNPKAPAVAPSFSPAAGTYPSAQSVAITSGTVKAVIRFTTNGSVPTETSPIYSTPIPVPATLTLQAVTFADGYAPSPVGSALYTIGR